jgi:hypothetical protein
MAKKKVTGTPFGQSPAAAKAASKKAPKTSGFVPSSGGGGVEGASFSKSSTPTVASVNSFIDTLKTKLSDIYVLQGLNPDGSTKTTTQRMQDERAAEAGLTTAQAATNPIFNKASAPSAPAGFKYTWIGGTNTGKWTLYPLSATNVGMGVGTGKNLEDGADTTGTKMEVPTTNVEVLKALLKSQGFAASIVDSSASYLNSLLKDNIDYDNAVEIFLNTKEYTLKNGTKVTSPFYTSYGYLNEGLTVPKKPNELFNAVEGYKELREKYGFSEKYLSSESLKGYVKNNVTVALLDERANAARLAALTADPSKTSAFIKLGYISSEAGLQDFFMDSKIGKEQLDLNRNTGAFVAEAIRRNSSGVLTNEVSLSDFRKISASLTDKGYSETQIANLAATGFENISQKLQPTIALSGIFEKTPGTEATISTIQSELESEQFMGMPSSRIRRLKEQNIKGFQGEAGTTSGSFRGPSSGLV